MSTSHFGRALPVIVALCGLACLIYGLWPEPRSPNSQDAVGQFFTALQRGDARGARGWLESPPASSASTASASASDAGTESQVTQAEQAEIWTPSPTLTWRILKSQEQSGHALVRVYVKDQGYFAEPELSLSRDARGQWRITRIELVRVDSRFEDLQRRRGEAADLQLAAELEAALRGQPGVLVERDDPGETVRR